MSIKIQKPAVLPQDFYVYLHCKATTGEVFYVGKGTGRRAWQATNRNRQWSNIVRRHGLTIEIVISGLQEWAAHEIERDLIALHGRRDLGHGPLVNFTDGGDGVSGWVPKPETLEKMAAANREKYRSDPEWREKKAEIMRAMAADPEWQAKNAAAARARAANQEWRAKNAAARLALAADPVWRAKNAERCRSLAANPEWLAKVSAANRKSGARPIKCVETGQKFDAIVDAVDWLRSNGVPRPADSVISATARGRQKTAYGYTWRYVDQQTVTT